MPTTSIPTSDGVRGRAPLVLRYQVQFEGELAAGLWPYSDEVVVIVDSGNPGGEPGEFAEWIRQAIAQWYDGAAVTLLPRQTCPRCKGSGVIQHPAWERFWQRYDKPTDADVSRHFQNEGYAPHEIPPEEIACERCDGTGEI